MRPNQRNASSAAQTLSTSGGGSPSSFSSSSSSSQHAPLLTAGRLVTVAFCAIFALFWVGLGVVGGGGGGAPQTVEGGQLGGEEGIDGLSHQQHDNGRKEGKPTTIGRREKDGEHQRAVADSAGGAVSPHSHAAHSSFSSSSSFPSPPSAYRMEATNALQSMVCPRIAPPTTLDRLTSFAFWGTTMNTSSPCPTSGLNNQIAMLLGLIYCAVMQKKTTAADGGGLGSLLLGSAAAGSDATISIPSSLLSDLRGANNIAGDNKKQGSSINNEEVLSDGAPRASSSSPSLASLALPHNVFRFKDISCTPTGGKEGGKSFKVGSADYEYAWFRWSEVFDVHGEGAVNALKARNPLAVGALSTVGEQVAAAAPAAATSLIFSATKESPSVRVCLRDDFTWSEHAWMKSRKCATTVDHFYGTALFWQIRSLLPLHRWYYALANEFLLSTAAATAPAADTDEGAGALSPSLSPPLSTIRARTLAIHVRRGDYTNFCIGTASTSGVKKFRVAPFIWMKRGGVKTEEQGLAASTGAPLSASSSSSTSQHYNAKFLNLTSATSLSSKFMDSCAPSDDRVMSLTEHVLKENWKRCRRGGGGGRVDESLSSSSSSSPLPLIECIDTIAVMTNSGEFYRNLQAHFAGKRSAGGGDAASHFDSLKVVSMRDWVKPPQSEGGAGAFSSPSALAKALDKVRWPSRRDSRITSDGSASSSSSSSSPPPTRLTNTEASMIDVALLSLAGHVILNRYSTFSQSAIDFRAIREGSLEGLRMYWW